MKPNQQAVIFDWNGTLLADTSLGVSATNAAIAVLGVKPTTLRGFQKAYTMPLKPFYMRLGCAEKEIDKKLNEIFAAFGKYYETGVHRVRLRRGARETLRHLQEKDHRSAVLSNHTVQIISNIAQRMSIYDYFDAILANGCEELCGIMHKADKGSRLKAFTEKHDIRRALVVGDSAEEIEIAHKYGFLGVGIKGGFSCEATIRAAKPDFMIGSLTELPAIISRVFHGGGMR